MAIAQGLGPLAEIHLFPIARAEGFRIERSYRLQTIPADIETEAHAGGNLEL